MYLIYRLTQIFLRLPFVLAVYRITFFRYLQAEPASGRALHQKNSPGWAFPPQEEPGWREYLSGEKL